MRQYDVFLLSFRNLEHLLTLCQKADIIHVETKPDMHGLMSISRIQTPQMAGFRLFISEAESLIRIWDCFRWKFCWDFIITG